MKEKVIIYEGSVMIKISCAVNANQINKISRHVNTGHVTEFILSKKIGQHIF